MVYNKVSTSHWNNVCTPQQRLYKSLELYSCNWGFDDGDGEQYLTRHSKISWMSGDLMNVMGLAYIFLSFSSS